jgi:hypothetical protein
MKVKFTLMDKIFNRKIYLEYKKVLKDNKNANDTSDYSELLLLRYIKRDKTLRMRICKSCGAYELQHYYPILNNITNGCMSFNPMKKIRDRKVALDFIYLSQQPMPEEKLLKNIEKEIFEGFKLTGMIKTG